MEVTLSSPQVAARLPWRVTRLEWAARGGPKRAWMQAELPAELAALGAGLCDGLLGRPLSVLDADGAPCWWGYVHAATLAADGQAQRLSFDGFANRVAALYPTPGGGWAQTAWAQDDLSLERWPLRETLLRSGGGLAGAEAARDALLAASAQPRWAAVAEPAGPDGATLTLEARGWWEQLNWMYYAPSGGRVEHALEGGISQPVGAGAANTKAAQSFCLSGESWPVGEVWMRVGKRGTPTDALRLELCADAGAAPGTALAWAEVSAAALPVAPGWVRFALAGPALAAETPCWLALGRTGGLDAANYYTAQLSEELSYPGGECRLWDGSTWSPRTPPGDLGFRVEGAQTAGECIAALAGLHPYLNGVRLDAPLDQPVLRWRDGRSTLLAEMQAVLAACGCLGEVEADRALRVRPVPPRGAFAATLRGGEIVDGHGRPWQASRALAGRWVRAGDAAVWVERLAWEDGMLRVEA
jgi:hypothetical protein